MVPAYKIVGIAFGLGIVIDYLWLGIIAQPFFKKHLGPWMYETITARPQSLISALVVYALLVLGLYIFILKPANQTGNWDGIWLQGALFGAICYGVYEYTNYAIIKNWPFIVTVVDTAWGAFLCGLIVWITARLVR